MKRRWLLVPLPLLLGILGALALGLWLPASPVIYLRADLVALVLLLGIIGSLVVVLLLLVQLRQQQARQIAAREVQLQAADDRRRFLGRLDHELKNPLTAIRLGLANLTELPSNVSRQDTLSTIATQTVRLSRLSADLRKLAELETRPLESAPVDVTEMLQEVLALAQERPEASERRLMLSVPRAPWPLPAVAGDRDLLFLAFYNLLDNALKFTEPGDTIELRALEDGSSVVIDIADTGAGVAAEEQPHVWEDLYRGQAAREIPGSGLGLALVRAIIQRHNGSTVLRSRPGTGTVVTVRLPASHVTER